MECKRRLALWCSVALFIFSVVLFSLYFSCTNICVYQQKSFAAPVWTAALGILIAIFGFVISSKKLKNIWVTIFASWSVICMICTLVCIYLVIGALISEFRHKAGNEYYMTAMVLWIAICAATGVMFVFSTTLTCGLLCCQRTQDENGNADAMVNAAWSTSAQTRPADFIRDPPPPYSPPSTEQTGDAAAQLAPTAPPLFLSATLQREQGMASTPSADRRSFSANIVEISEIELAPVSTSVMNEYTEMPSFSGVDEDDTSTTNKETNENNSGETVVSEGTSSHKTLTDSVESALNSVERAINSGETPLIVETAVNSGETVAESGETAATEDDGHYDEIMASRTVRQTLREREPEPQQETEKKTENNEENDYDYASTELRLVTLPSEQDHSYANSYLGSPK